jgi:hypothetical protein
MALHHQIVRVVSGHTLITSDLATNRYETRNRQPLTPGIYTVLWPAYVRMPRYDEEARYVGPFRTVEHAKLLVHLCIAEYFLEKRVTRNVVMQRAELLLH